MSNITLVTGIWDIGRGELTEGWSRPYQHYLDKFEKLLEVEENLIIFGDEELKEFVFKRRSSENTQFIIRPLSWFTNSEFFPMIQKIRTSPEWYNQVGWLQESTQARLDNYNPLVMSKVFLLHDAKIMDQFNSEYMFWIDGGLTNTVHPGYFTHDKVLDKLGFSEYWDENGTWGGRTLTFKNGIRFRIIEQGEMDDDTEGYPSMMKVIAVKSANTYALEWIDANFPKAWFRPMFAG